MNKVIPIAAGLLVLAIAAWWFLLPSRQIVPADDPQTVAAAFLDQVRAGQVDQAWESSGVEFKSFMGRDQFRLLVKKHPELKGPATPGEVVNEGPLRSCSFMCGKLKLAIIVASADGRWRVEGVKVE
jgi:hypothetical protein